MIKQASTPQIAKDKCAAIFKIPAAVGVGAQAAEGVGVIPDHSATSVTTPTTSTFLQPRPAADTSLRRSATPIGSLLRERMFFLATCFLRVAEQPERELSIALRWTARVVMSTKLARVLAARRELWHLGAAGRAEVVRLRRRQVMIGALGLGVRSGEAAGLLRVVASDGGGAAGLSGSSGRSEGKLEVTEVEVELLVLLAPPEEEVGVRRRTKAKASPKTCEAVSTGAG